MQEERRSGNFEFLDGNIFHFHFWTFLTPLDYFHTNKKKVIACIAYKKKNKT